MTLAGYFALNSGYTKKYIADALFLSGSWASCRPKIYVYA